MHAAQINGQILYPNYRVTLSTPDADRFDALYSSGTIIEQDLEREDTIFEGASVLIETNPDLWKKLPEVANEFLRNLQISR